MRFWAIFRATRVVWSNGWAFVSNVWSFFGLKMTQIDPNWPKLTQNDPKMTPKWPKMTQNDQKSIFPKMFLHHFWPFLGWFGVILGCFERVLVIFGPRNNFKWPYLGSVTASLAPKITVALVTLGFHDFGFWRGLMEGSVFCKVVRD